MGPFYAYFLDAPRDNTGAIVTKGKPLTYGPVSVHRLGAGGTLTFGANAWADYAGASAYTVQADAGDLYAIKDGVRDNNVY